MLRIYCKTNSQVYADDYCNNIIVTFKPPTNTCIDDIRDRGCKLQYVDTVW